MRTQDAKAIHMVDLLADLGHEPQNQARGEWWYNSPFRQETKPSFKVSRDGKAWYDHGAGRGGNILKFVCSYYGLPENDISGALGKLDGLNITRSTTVGDPTVPSSEPSLWENTHQRAVDARREARRDSGREQHQRSEDDGFSVVKIQPVQNWSLINYLKERGIDAETARPWVQEMHYERNGKPYFSLAFESRSGGFELRNRHFKGGQGKKDISVLSKDNGAGGHIAVFEGFFDFLSWLQHMGSTKPAMPVLVMNSVGLRKRAVDAIQEMGVNSVHLYADRDKTGRELVEYMAQKLEGIEVIDESGIYASFHDYNEFLIQNRQAALIA